MQVSIDFPNEGNITSRYYMTDKTGQGMWNTSYLWLKQVRDMMDIAKQEGDNNNLAIGTILMHGSMLILQIVLEIFR
jgi:hypothetical protein